MDAPARRREGRRERGGVTIAIFEAFTAAIVATGPSHPYRQEGAA